MLLQGVLTTQHETGLSWLQLTVPSQGSLPRVKSNPCWELKSDNPKMYKALYQEKCTTKLLINIQENPSSSGTRKWNPARSQIEQILQAIRTVSIRSWAKIWFAHSSGTRKWNPARPELSKISTNQNYFNQVMS